MRSYSHLIAKLFEPLLITPARAYALCQLMEAKLSGKTIHVMDDDIDDTPGGGTQSDDDEIESVGTTCIIPVHGTIVKTSRDLAMSECGCPLDELCAKIDMVEADSNIDTVVYHFDTPGGSVTGLPETARKILNSRKRTVAFTDSECCSAGLWLAEQCQEFWATESSRVGSCGVFCLTMDESEFLKEQGVKVNAVFAGRYKLLGASFKPLEKDEREILQANIDKIYDQFKQAMESHRVMDDKDFGNGLVFDGPEAAERGFTNGVCEDMQELLEILDR